MWQRETHEQLYSLYKKKDDTPLALRHFEKFHELKELCVTQDMDIRVSALKALNNAAQAQKKLQESEHQLLLRRQELDLTLLHLQQKDAVLKGLKHVIEEIKKEKLVGSKALALLNHKLEQSLITVTESDSFKEKINDGTRNFVQILRKRFPEITKREAEIASLLNKGMSSKEISELVVIDIRAIEQHRYRVRKKLGLKTGDDLALALMNLVASP